MEEILKVINEFAWVHYAITGMDYDEVVRRFEERRADIEDMEAQGLFDQEEKFMLSVYLTSLQDIADVEDGSVTLPGHGYESGNDDPDWH